MKKYYILAWGCDEGPDNAMLFRAYSHIDVCQHLLNNRGKYDFVIRMIEKRFGPITIAEELVDGILDSYVDGDTFYSVVLLEREAIDC